MKSIRKKYSDEFKKDAVELLLQGRSATELSRDLGVNVSSLNRWRRSYLRNLDTQHDGNGQSPSEMAAEINRLRKELAEQREINVILKKTIKYVS